MHVLFDLSNIIYPEVIPRKISKTNIGAQDPSLLPLLLVLRRVLMSGGCVSPRGLFFIILDFLIIENLILASI
jgi:hypothetical protein